VSTLPRSAPAVARQHEQSPLNGPNRPNSAEFRRRAGSRRVGPLIALLVAVAATGCSTTGSPLSATGTLTRIEPAKRVAAPHLTGTTLTGTPFDSATLAGRVIVYNVWGSWCAPCRKEAPALAAAAKATATRATFVGIDTRDSGTAQAQALVREAGITYESVFDPDGRLLLQFPDLPPSAIPTTIVVDAQGRVAARILGETTEATLTGLIDDAAAGR